MSSVDPSAHGRFIVGMARSGTTLLATMLAAHPDIDVPPETRLFANHWDAVRTVCRAAPGQRKGAVRTLLARREVADMGLANPDGVMHELDRLRPCTPGAVIGHVLDARCREAGKASWVEKTPRHVRFLNRITEAFPRARILVMVRDPRDVSLSLRAAWDDSNVFLHYRRWRSANLASASCHASHPGQIKVVRYEDLITDPAAALADACAFLEVPYSEAMLEYHHKQPTTVVIGRESWKRKNLEPLDRGNAGKWRAAMAPWEVWLAQRLLRRDMEALGYGIDDSEQSGWQARFVLAAALRLVRETGRFVRRRLTPRD